MISGGLRAIRHQTTQKKLCAKHVRYIIWKKSALVNKIYVQHSRVLPMRLVAFNRTFVRAKHRSTYRRRKWVAEQIKPEIYHNTWYLNIWVGSYLCWNRLQIKLGSLTSYGILRPIRHSPPPVSPVRILLKIGENSPDWWHMWEVARSVAWNSWRSRRNEEIDSWVLGSPRKRWAGAPRSSLNACTRPRMSIYEASIGLKVVHTTYEDTTKANLPRSRHATHTVAAPSQLRNTPSI